MKPRGPFKDRQIAALPAAPDGGKRIRYYDSPHLSLAVERMPSGTIRRYWRMDYYRPGGRGRGEISLGVYPATGLAEARRKRDEFLRALGQGIDPSHHRRAAERVAATENTPFAEVCALYLAEVRTEGGRRASTIARMERHQRVIERGDLAKAPIGALSRDLPLFKSWLRDGVAIRDGATSEARKLCDHLGRVFNWAAAHGYCTGNPAKWALKSLPRHIVESFAAVTDPVAVGELMRAIRNDGNELARSAMGFLALTFVRPGNVLAAEWSEIDWERALWTIPMGKMKMHRRHEVALSRQAMGILRAIHPITGGGRYIFTSGDVPHSHTLFDGLLRRIGWHGRHTAHGFRAMASTLLHGDSEHGFRPPDACDALKYDKAIELQLAHGDADKVAAIYDRNSMWAIRVALVQWWADRLDLMRDGARLRLVV
jgi:integrase